MLSRIVLNNFLSWGDLDYEFPQGVTLIDGWNEDDQTSEGSGKSSVVNAISWACYGKIPKVTNIDDVIKTGTKSCKVELTFDNGDAIVRSRKPNDLYLERAGEVLRGKDAIETKDMIVDYLGISFETFCQTIYFAQNYDKKFITANQEEKANILSEAQDLKVFDKARDEAKSMLKIEEQKLAQLQQSYELRKKDLEIVEQKIIREDEQAEAVKQKHAHELASLQQQIELVETKLAAIRERYETAKVEHQKRITEKANELESLAKESNAKLQELAEAQKLVLDTTPLEGELQRQQEIRADLRSKLNQIDEAKKARAQKEASAKTVAARYQSTQDKINKLKAFIADPSKECPTCKTPLEAADTSHAEAEVKAFEVELADTLTTLTSMAEEIAQPLADATELQTEINVVDSLISKINQKIQENHNQKNKVVQLEIGIANVEVTIEKQRVALSVLEGEIIEAPVLDVTEKESLTAKLAEKQANPPVYDQTNKQSLIVELGSINESILSFSSLEKAGTDQINRLNTLRDGFREVKAHVFKSLLNEINVRSAHYLGSLFEVPATIQFVDEGMKIATNITLDGVERSLGLLSGGQFRRFSLAVDLSLVDIISGRTASKFGMTFWDEYMKDLSETSMERVLNIFRERKEPTFMIEHNSIFKQIVDNKLMVRLVDGTSSLEE